MPKRNKIKISTYIHPKQLAALKSISAKTGIPQSVIIRKGLDLAIKVYGKKSR
jgi:hypothetical protein